MNQTIEWMRSSKFLVYRFLFRILFSWGKKRVKSSRLNFEESEIEDLNIKQMQTLFNATSYEGGYIV